MTRNPKLSSFNPTHTPPNFLPPIMSEFYSDPLQSNFDPSFDTAYSNYPIEWSDFEISELMIADNGSEEGSTSTQIEYGTPNPVPSEQQEEFAAHTGGGNRTERRQKAEGKKPKTDALRVAFRTKSKLEIMDDGYKWRKYGKKSVKNSPNPRNYYRCSHQGCQVKKRVERDREDASYVITTYDGVHSHESPSILYYNEMSLMVPNGWTLQASQSSC